MHALTNFISTSLNFANFGIVKELKGHIDQIKQLCNTYHVKSLFAFGSVISGKLRTDSDIDLIVDIHSDDPIEYSENYFALKFQLENILNRPVDLIEARALKNPFLKKQIDKTKVLVYGR